MKLLTSLFAFLVFLSTAPQVQAVCPICTIAVGAGLGFSRYLGIDDTVTGLWIGALILSSALWTASWLKSKTWRIPYKTATSIVFFYLLVVPPLYWMGMIGHDLNKLWGVDKILLGTTVGSLVFTAGYFLDQYLRTINEGKVFIYFQRVISPVLLLSIASVIFFLITAV
jgi:hypothetical protein